MKVDDKILKKAFKILRRNYGCPGKDGISIKNIKDRYERFEEKLIYQIEDNSYIFSDPIFTEFIDFSNKKRVVCVYVLLDRWLQHYLKLIVSPQIFNILQPYVYGNIFGRTNIQATSRILEYQTNYVLKLDISNFFTSIDKERALKNLYSIGKNDEMETLIKESFASPNSTGLPLGHVLSPIISNLYLNEFDNYFPKRYSRFCDDLIFACDDLVEIEAVIKKTRRYLSELGLTLNESKIKIFNSPKMEELL